MIMQPNNSETHRSVIFAFWAISFSEFIMVFVYKKKKPYTIFIKDNELILNRRWTLKRNLTELIQIRYDRFSKNLKLGYRVNIGRKCKFIGKKLTGQDKVYYASKSGVGS